MIGGLISPTSGLKHDAEVILQFTLTNEIAQPTRPKVRLVGRLSLVGFGSKFVTHVLTLEGQAPHVTETTTSL